MVGCFCLHFFLFNLRLKNLFVDFAAFERYEFVSDSSKEIGVGEDEVPHLSNSSSKEFPSTA